MTGSGSVDTRSMDCARVKGDYSVLAQTRLVCEAEANEASARRCRSSGEQARSNHSRMGIMRV